MLKITDLRARFGDFAVLRGIDLEVQAGEVLALIGESGTGKTTLARAILGLSQARLAGEINFNGQNLLTMSKEQWQKVRWRHIAMVFQNVEEAFNPLYPVLDQVMEPLLVHTDLSVDQAREKAVAWLEKVGLAGTLHRRYPHQLSGGQKQKALIAMAFILEPSLLILDEPTSALDPLGRLEVLHLLRELRQNRTMLIITHDFATAAQLADRVAVLYGGKLAEVGPAGELLENPRHPYTRGVLRSYPNMTTTKELQGIPGNLEWTEVGCPFAPRCTQQLDVCQRESPALAGPAEHRIACHRGGIVPLLRCQGLSQEYEGMPVLKQVELTLYEGETVALVGESGSGKTTLAKCIMGLVPYQGQLWLKEKPVAKRHKEFYRQVQMVFQSPAASLSHRHTVLEAVAEPLEIQGLGKTVELKEKVQQVLAEVQLPWDEEFLAELVHHLSGGEAQRVAIARALILNPALLIADEPTSALDPSVQAKIIKLLLQLQENRGLGILFITHDLALARKISDRIVVLKQGRIVEEGPSHRVAVSPQHPYTRRLLEAAPGWQAPFPGTGVEETA
ncbi:MAG: ABC transporter ATP-binding protein [Clostridia bacterium]|nr:ABC transporter ATP-binding protein [Clostridia bacterium]